MTRKALLWFAMVSMVLFAFGMTGIACSKSSSSSSSPAGSSASDEDACKACCEREYEAQTSAGEKHHGARANAGNVCAFNVGVCEPAECDDFL